MDATHGQGRLTPLVRSAQCSRMCQPQAQTTPRHRAHLTRGVAATAVHDGGGGRGVGGVVDRAGQSGGGGMHSWSGQAVGRFEVGG